MGRGTSNESSPLLPHESSPSMKGLQLKFPLGLVSETVRPYLELIRLEKPTGTILMFWPFAWGLTMAAYKMNLPLQAYGNDFAICVFGAFIMRSSACTINDIFDRKMDAGVERTKNRPLASGRISVLAATIYLMIQYIIGTLFFYFTVEGLALWVAIFQLIPIFAIYPLLKRVTYWPQAWLGLAMNFGFVTAWVSSTGTFDLPLLGTVMLGCWCWTMLYDTIYACQDIKDDVKMGVHSTAILFGSRIRPLLMGCAAIFVAAFGVAGYLNNQGLPYYTISVFGTFLHVIWQFKTVDLEEPASCWRNFNRNGHLGWIIWGGLMVDYLLNMEVVQF